MEQILIDLGWGIAAIRPNINKNSIKLTIMTPSSIDEGYGFEPAQSIEIVGIDKIRRLYEGLEEYLKDNDKSI